MPNCIVYVVCSLFTFDRLLIIIKNIRYYIVLNRVIVRKLLKNFTFWYLLFNIFGVFISLGRLFWDFRIMTLAFAFPNLTLAIFLDALPYAYRYRTWISFWSLNLITLCLTQYIIFSHAPDIEYAVRISDTIQFAVPVTHVASSCNINMIILSVQFMFSLSTSPESFVILSSPMESLKVDSDVAKVGLMVMSSLRNSNDSNETKSDDAAETTESKSPSKVAHTSSIDPSKAMKLPESKSPEQQHSINSKALRRPREL